MKDFYVSGGINGVGKSSVTMRALEIGGNFELVHLGKYFEDIMKTRGIKVNLDTIRLFEDEKSYKEIQTEVFLKAVEDSDKSSKSKIVIDSHYAMRMKFGYIKGFPESVLGMMNPKALFLIEASLDEIKYRREIDKSRRRDYSFEQNIEEMLKKEREYAQICSSYCGAPLHIIRNENGKLEETAREFIKKLK